MKANLLSYTLVVACLGACWLPACGDKVNPAAKCEDLMPRPVTYTGTMNSLLNQCTGCHSSKNKGAARQGATIGVDLDGYDNAVKWGQESREWVLGGLMPPAIVAASGPPGINPNLMVLEDRCKFATWARNGFPR